jgi:hypothetical protein
MDSSSRPEQDWRPPTIGELTELSIHDQGRSETGLRFIQERLAPDQLLDQWMMESVAMLGQFWQKFDGAVPPFFFFSEGYTPVGSKLTDPVCYRSSAATAQAQDFGDKRIQKLHATALSRKLRASGINPLMVIFGCESWLRIAPSTDPTLEESAQGTERLGPDNSEDVFTLCGSTSDARCRMIKLQIKGSGAGRHLGMPVPLATQANGDSPGFVHPLISQFWWAFYHPLEAELEALRLSRELLDD